MNLSGSTTEGASRTQPRPRSVGGARIARRRCRPAAEAHAALFAAPRARRPHGAVRRLRDAGAVPVRHHRRASAHPRRGRAVRRLAYGPAAADRSPTRRRRSKRLVPGDIRGLGPMRMRYTLLLNDGGGILDDLMATRLADGLVRRRQRRDQGRRPRVSARPPPGWAWRSSRSTTAPCWRCRGRWRPRSWSVSPAASRGWRL